MKELDKLRKLLEENDIAYTNKSIVSENDGIDIVYKNYDISVTSHKYSYGGDRGLLEIMASFIDNSVKGYMTADEVLTEIKTLGDIEVNPEELVKGKMQEIAKKVKEELPEKFGFVVLAFKFNEEGQMIYVSNADRQDIVKAMKEWIEKTESEDKQVIIRDLENPISYGDECDKVCWMQLLEILKKEGKTNDYKSSK